MENTEFEDMMFMGSLDGAPEVASELGRAVAAFTAVEVVIVMVIAHCLGEDDRRRMSHLICGRMRNISERITLAKEMIDRADLDEVKQAQLLEVMNEVAQLNNERNTFMHSTWESNARGQVSLRGGFSSRSKKINHQKGPQGQAGISATSTEDILQQLSRFRDRCRVLVGKLAGILGVPMHSPPVDR